MSEWVDEDETIGPNTRETLANTDIHFFRKLRNCEHIFEDLVRICKKKLTHLLEWQDLFDLHLHLLLRFHFHSHFHFPIHPIVFYQHSLHQLLQERLLLESQIHRHIRVSQVRQLEAYPILLRDNQRRLPKISIAFH